MEFSWIWRLADSEGPLAVSFAERMIKGESFTGVLFLVFWMCFSGVILYGSVCVNL